MAPTKNGDTVRIHYTGKLEDGTVFGSTVAHDPLEFTIGEDQLIPGFEQALVGMYIGQSKTIRIPSDKAFGPHLKELVVNIDRREFPGHMKPKVGQRLQIPRDDGQKVMVTVTEVSESSVTLDGNHPLAGKDVIFDIQLIEIV